MACAPQPHPRTGADRTLLRHAAWSCSPTPPTAPARRRARLLAVQDPQPGPSPRALSHPAAGDPYLPPSAVAAALPTHPVPVLDAFRARLRGPHAGEALRRLADATTPALARRVAALPGEAVVERPRPPGTWPRTSTGASTGTPRPRRTPPLVTGLLDDGP
ncbi:hypothetical protein LV779_06000 [Streptomyces thinghirensis]|nr:hypothetical protein [Streptomyces thinghirensis]